jgi:NADH-quinone oxidoreductase subunit L
MVKPLLWFIRDVWIVPLLPLATAALMLFAGRRMATRAIGWICSASVGVAFLWSFGVFALFVLTPETMRFVWTIGTWLPATPFHASGGRAGSFGVDWAMQIDPLSVVMMLIVTGVGFLVHVYSIGYMDREDARGLYRYFGCMNLFIFAMLTLVMAANMAVLFVGWEAVSACSYLLIGYHFHKRAAADAAKKAFVVNRVGDAALLLGVFAMAATLGTLRFDQIGPALSRLGASGGSGVGPHALLAVALLILAGAVGKSAQIPLFVWLPDAMEAPTPVSALIHAATMVTAGVYVVARTSAIFVAAPESLAVVATIGALTALLAASMAVVQTDIKKVLAYSTISQLGYMFLACGVGAFAAGIFHLMTHAFFKSLLFLAAGSVIHALSGEQDLRKMGGLRRLMPLTYVVTLIAALAISGVFPFAGFLSKDLILGEAYEKSLAVWAVGFVTAGMTAFYMFRLIFLAFHGEARGPHGSTHDFSVAPTPPTIAVPLVVLAGLSVVGGWIGWPQALGGDNRFARFLEPLLGSPNAARVQPLHGAGSATGQIELMVLSEVLVGIGIFAAWWLYVKRTDLPEKLARRFHAFREVVWHGYYVNAFYEAVFVNGTKTLSRELDAFDRHVIDGVGVRGTARLVRLMSRLAGGWDKYVVDGAVRMGATLTEAAGQAMRYVQTGFVQMYMLAIVAGVIGFLGYYFYLAAHVAHAVR